VRDILVLVRDPSHWHQAVAYACDLAARCGTSLTGVHVESGANGGSAADDAAVAERFIAHANEMGVADASWQVAAGDVAPALSRLSSWHDLVVVDREPHGTVASVSELGDIVVASLAPVILVPPRRREASLDSVALAWNHSEEALHAIHSARPLLERARRVVLLEGGDDDARAERGWNPKFDIARYLEHQGLRGERHAIQGNGSAAGEMIALAARRCHADLLVMGAYGRSRLSEWALGGATRSVLFDASIPVFLKH
jgi:nucleotide-binding universal stress UspA family protein